MTEGRRKSRWGWAWLALIALPPVIVVIGLVLFLSRQVREGTITPKWKPKPAATQPVSGSPTNR